MGRIRSLTPASNWCALHKLLTLAAFFVTAFHHCVVLHHSVGFLSELFYDSSSAAYCYPIVSLDSPLPSFWSDMTVNLSQVDMPSYSALPVLLERLEVAVEQAHDKFTDL